MMEHSYQASEMWKFPLVAVAINDNNKTSQSALKWAVEHVIKRGQTVILVHVNTKGTLSNGPCDVAGYKQPNGQLKELFLPYRCFCCRKDVHCKDVVLDDVDEVRALCEFISSASIEIMVLGSSPKRMFRELELKYALKASIALCALIKDGTT